MTAEPQTVVGGAEAHRPIYEPSKDGPFRQGEILSALHVKELTLESVKTGAETSLVARTHPYAIVLSQDCDLEQDFRLREKLTSKEHSGILPAILLCEVFTAAELRGRELNSTIWARVRINKDERYHFFEGVPRERDRLGQSLPELGVDFKRYFTVPTDELYVRAERGSVERRCTLRSPYLEHVSTRFAYYQFRVALPRDHESLTEARA